MTAPIGIAYMLNQFEDGGAERQLVELIRRLDRTRFRPLLYLGSASGRIAEELPDLNLPVRYVRGPHGSKLAALRLAGELRRERIEIVHAWQFVANTWGRIAGTVARVPIIITSDRGMDTEIGPAYRWIDVALGPLSDRVIVNAEAVAENVHRTRFVRRAKIDTVYNGVDLDAYKGQLSREAAKRSLGIPVDRPAIGMVASFCARKRWDLFLDAAAAGAGGATVICVGDGELRPAMERQASSLGIGERAQFLGLRADIPEIMAALDVFVLSSDDEGMPNAVMQAMSASRAVVATDAGGTAELVVDGETGFVVPRGDAAPLAERISRLLNDPLLAERFGQSGRARVERHFTCQACVANTVAVYEDLLERHARTRALSHAA